MIISHEYKLVFIHIGKNAGTFVTELILNIVPTLNYYYLGSNLGDGTIVQFLTQTCDSATYFTTVTEPGSSSCPPPA